MAPIDTIATTNGREIRLTNLDKALWPDDGFTKADLIDYLVSVSPVLLKHLKDRPLVLTRYPDGIGGEWFYQKDCPDYAPEWIQTFPHQAEERLIRFILANGGEDLAWLGNQAAIEIHPWLSRAGSEDSPDFAVFDLDPAPPAGWDDVLVVARALKVCLDHLGLRAYPKTSGATGIHIYVPVAPVYTYRDTAVFVRAVAELVMGVLPDRVTLSRAVKKRAGRVYVDYLQNIKGKTIVGPYIPRPLKGAPVSTPVTWTELEGIDPARFSIKTVPARIRAVGDLFEPVLLDKQLLDPAMKSLGVVSEGFQ